MFAMDRQYVRDIPSRILVGVFKIGNNSLVSLRKAFDKRINADLNALLSIDAFPLRINVDLISGTALGNSESVYEQWHSYNFLADMQSTR